MCSAEWDNGHSDSDITSCLPAWVIRADNNHPKLNIYWKLGANERLHSTSGSLVLFLFLFFTFGCSVAQIVECMQRQAHGFDFQGIKAKAK